MLVGSFSIRLILAIPSLARQSVSPGIGTIRFCLLSNLTELSASFASDISPRGGSAERTPAKGYPSSCDYHQFVVLTMLSLSGTFAFFGKAKARAQEIFVPIKLFFNPNQLRMSSISRVGSHSLPFHFSKHLQPVLEWDMSLVDLYPSCRHKVFIKCSRLRGEHLTRVAPCFSAWVEWFYFFYYYSIKYYA